MTRPFALRSRKRIGIGLRAVSFTALCCMLAACSSTPKNQDASKKALSGTDEQIFVGDTIEKNYDPNVIMKRGEAFFEKEEYAEAIVEYNHFLELHRTHMLAPYAMFRIGESQMRRAKGIHRDPEPIQKAIEAFERLRKEYPGNRYEAQALEKLQECHDLLAQTHLIVGQFYYRRGSYLAAAHRFEQIMKLYPDKSVAPEALYFLALSYHDLGADDWASEQLILLTEKYPSNKHEGEARGLLAKIGNGSSSTMLAKKSDTAPSGPPPIATDSDSRITFPSGFPPQTANGLVGIPSANTLAPSFVTCRLGAWC
jgi:outer membrane protein assembly factor BamD